MAWLGKVSLGGFPDLAGTVAKLSESVKNIEKNFDSALGLEERSDAAKASSMWPSASDGKALFDPVMAFMGHKGDDTSMEESDNLKSSEQPSSAEEHEGVSAEVSPASTAKRTVPVENDRNSEIKGKDDNDSHIADVTLGTRAESEPEKDNTEYESKFSNTETELIDSGNTQGTDFTASFQHNKAEEAETTDETEAEISLPQSSVDLEGVEGNISDLPTEMHLASGSPESNNKRESEAEAPDDSSPVHNEVMDNKDTALEKESSAFFPVEYLKIESTSEHSGERISTSSITEPDPSISSDFVTNDINASSELQVACSPVNDPGSDNKEEQLNTTLNLSDTDSAIEVEKLKKEIRLMEASMLGAARQAQTKADEIAKLMNENEYLRSVIEDLKRKSAEAETEALRDEYHQRVSSLERKVYALTRERDTLRREQNKKSDATALLKEKDEIISQVMAEGEELSKKQASQEATIRKLRAQIREFEEEKQRLNSKLQVEETKVESIKRDKAATEKLLQETIERNQAELSAQKEFYTNALNTAKEAEALAEARANNEARVELESRLRDATERETLLVQTLEELRQTLSRTEQQAVFREDMLRRDIEDLQKRYQASELRYNELITQVPESTRPLLRQIEAMQETSSRRAEVWAGVERTLNSRLQEAEAKAAGAEERERAMNERLSQTLSRITVLETQIACLRTEQTQLSRSLEKERQRASENRQEYLAAMEEAATQEGRAKQLEDEVRELRNKSRHDMQEEVSRRELLEKELKNERASRLELEKSASRQTSPIAPSPYSENGSAPLRKLSSAGSLSSMEESLFLQASLDSSGSYFSERRLPGEANISPYFLKSMTPSAFEAALRQKGGELASYMSRLASLESIRDSLAEELVKMTAQCEKLRIESAVVPGLRAELEALRRRHSSALELMGERDEELEELRADIIDLKEMYREQVDLLVNRLQTMTASVGAA